MKKVRKKKQKTDSVREREKKINKRLIKPQRKGWRRCRRWRSRADVDTRCNSKPTLRNGHRSTAERRRFFFYFLPLRMQIIRSVFVLFYFIFFRIFFFPELSTAFPQNKQHFAFIIIIIMIIVIITVILARSDVKKLTE